MYHDLARNKKIELLVLLSLVIVTSALYTPLLWSEFINFDDPALITQNPVVQAGLTWEGLRWAFTTGYVANWIPLSWLSHMLDAHLFGMNPAGHHLVNVLLHVATTALLYLFLRRTTGSVWSSAAVAALFAWHPLHVESVAWVAERKDVLSAFFWVLTLVLYARYAEKPGSARYGAMVASFTLGLLAKPMLVTLPLILLLLDWWPLGRCSVPSAVRSPWPRLFLEKIPLLALSVCSSVITYLVQAQAGTVSQGYTFAARAARVCVSYLTYLFMMVWPVDLAVIYPFDRYPPSPLIITGSLLALLAVTVAVFLARRGYPYLITGWGWYLISLLPVIGLIQIGQHSVADRYTYIPLIGIFIMTAWGFGRLAERLRLSPRLTAVAATVVLMILLVLTSIQVSYWKNSFTLFDHAVKVTSGNWVAHNNLALEYQAKGNLDEALRHFQLSIKAKPSYALAFLNLGALYRLKHDSNKALEAFRSAVMFEPGNQEAHVGLAIIYLDLGQRDLALEEYQRLQAVDSEYAAGLLQEIKKQTGKAP